MLVTNYSKARKNLKEYFDKAYDDNETIIVTRPNDKNVVIMSLDEYNNLMENNHVTQSKKNSDHLLSSIEQMKAGQTVTKTTKELEEMENG